MKVALVHDFLTKLGGAERVLKTFAEMYPQAPIFTLLYDEKACGKVFPRERVKTSWLQKLPSALRKRQKFLFPLMPRAIEMLDLSDYNLIISSSNAYAHGILTPSDSVHICYCHSPMRYAWDYAHKYMEEQKAGRFAKGLAGRMIKNVRFWDQIASDRPDYYIANSYHVSQRIGKYYRQKSEIIYPPVETDRFRANEIHEDYYLIVSTLTPYKKIVQAVQLFNKIQRRLVVIGDGPQRKYLEAVAGPTVDILGRKDDETVKTYLQNCRAYIMPNEEDFGISPVEAMACGKPVIAYAKGGILETVIPGKTGVLYLEPTFASLEDALGRFLTNEYDFKPHTIRRHALQFSEDKFKENFKKFVDTVASRHSLC
ncbi:glycosyltransferase [Candidatus Peregrinibacteria bacterium]|nr:glycosyltransferase [Candidatus Peregrinibacteria bacterium]